MPYREFDEEAQQRWWRIFTYIDSLDRRYKVNKRGRLGLRDAQPHFQGQRRHCQLEPVPARLRG